MCDNTKFSDSTWNRFLDFLTPSIDNLSDAEIEKDLKQRGISTDQLYQTIINEMDKRKSIKKFECARKNRKRYEDIMATLRTNISEPIEAVKERISALLKNQSVASVYFNRLNEAADEDDLQNLIEDLMLLEQMDNCDDDQSAK